MAGKLGAGFSVEKVAGTVSETTLRRACGFLLMSLPLRWLRLQAWHPWGLNPLGS